MKLGENPNYIKPKETTQDFISKNPKLIEEKLKNYVQIHPDNYKDIDEGVWIKYISFENKYRSGGVLVNNHAPEYFSLKNPYNGLMWSVDLTKNIIFMKDFNYSNMMRTQNNIILGVTVFILTIMGLSAVSKILDKKNSATGYIRLIGLLFFIIIIFFAIAINNTFNTTYNL